MGFSHLTRYELFLSSAELIRMNEIIRYKNYLEVESMYLNSAKLIKGFEKLINDENIKEREINYNKILKNNTNEISDKDFIKQIKNLISEQNKKSGSILTFKTFFRYLLKSMSIYHEKIIERNYIEVLNGEKARDRRKQVFLSYSYDDKGLTQALFYYFWMNAGFLYVDWMWNNVNPNSFITKRKIEDALKESNQFLFLRTTNSELKVQGNNSIRQWCAWEIGNYYTKHRGNKYYTSFYDTEKPKNDMLDTFKPLKEVINGVIK